MTFIRQTVHIVQFSKGYTVFAWFTHLQQVTHYLLSIFKDMLLYLRP